jgi:hypothetical protein
VTRSSWRLISLPPPLFQHFFFFFLAHSCFGKKMGVFFYFFDERNKFVRNVKVTWNFRIFFFWADEIYIWLVLIRHEPDGLLNSPTITMKS